MMASDWTFALMWSLTYAFQFFWVLYLTILTIKFASRESLFSKSFYISIILVNVGNCTMIYLWDDACNRDFESSRYIVFASIVCIIMDISLYWVLFHSMVTLLSPVHTGLIPEWVTSTMRRLLIVLLVNAVGYVLFCLFACVFSMFI